MITVAGIRYRVIDNLGFCHDRNQYAKVCETPDGERIAVRYSGCPWEWSRPVVMITKGRTACGQNEPHSGKESKQNE